MRKLKKCIVFLLATALILGMLPLGALASPSPAPTGSGTSFYANGTPITIQATIPDGGVAQTLDASFTATGEDAYIVWQDGDVVNYVGVSNQVTVFGGSDGSAAPVTVDSTSITMTGGSVWRIYGGNRGQDKTNPSATNPLTQPSAVTGNVDISVSGDATVSSLIGGGGLLNASVDGKVTISVETTGDLSNCYIYGGVHGNGHEGYIDTVAQKIYTNAIVNQAEVSVANTNASVVVGGGGGWTKVNQATVTIGDGEGASDTIIGYLYPAGINGETTIANLTVKSDAKITELAATNRGYLGTGSVSIEGGSIDNFYTGAASGCFNSDGNQASAVTNSITYEILDASGIQNAVITPSLNMVDGVTSVQVGNVSINNQDTDTALNLEIKPFAPTSSTTVTNVTLAEEDTLSIAGNTQVSIDADITLDNAGTIDNQGTGDIVNNGIINNKGTIEGSFTNNGSVVEDFVSGNGVNFYANGIPITIQESAPVDGKEFAMDAAFTATGTDAYIVWTVDGLTQYVGVSNQVVVFGGSDGSAAPVTVDSTSITMTGGSVWRIYGGNRGQDKTNPSASNPLTQPSTVTGNVDISVSGGTVKDYLAGGGLHNTSVGGKVTINISNGADLYSGLCYVNGGVHGNGREGYYDTANQQVVTNAIVNQVEINVENSHVGLVTAGGGGLTKVNEGVITIGDGEGTEDTIVDYLYPAGINGETVSSTVTVKTDAKITNMAATNRGYLGTGVVNIEGGTIDTLATGAASGCFNTDGNQASGVTEGITFNISDASGIGNMKITPNLNMVEGETSAKLGNLAINNTGAAELNISVGSFAPTSSTTVTDIDLDQEDTFSISGPTQVAIDSAITLNNAGTIDNQGTGTIVNNGKVLNSGTIQGNFDNQGSIIDKVLNLKFDEGTGNTAADSSKNGLDGTAQAGSWMELGRYGSAMVFGIEEQIVAVTGVNTGDNLPKNSMTISAWVKRDMSKAGGTEVLYAYGPKEAGHFELFLDAASTLKFYAPTIADAAPSMNAQILDENWHHTALVLDNGTLKFYLDGVETYSQPFTGELADSQHTLYVGGVSPTEIAIGQTFFFQGALDEFTIYDGVLSAEQVAGLAAPTLVESISLSQNTAELNLGETLTLTATVLPQNASNQAITWSSSDDEIATVTQEGKVTALAPGEVDIIATATDGTNKQAVCSVTVSDVDEIAPRVVSVGFADAKTINIVFNEAVDQESAQTISNYVTYPGITFASATLGADGKTVTLVADNDIAASNYQLSVSGVQDVAGNAIAPIRVLTNPALKLYLPMEEGEGTATKDFTGFHGDATAVVTNWTEGKMGSALEFGTTNQIMTVPNNDLQLVNSTISFWVKRNEVVPSLQGFFGKDDKLLNSHFEAYLESDASIHFYAPAVGNFAFDAKLLDTEWHHLALVTDEAGTISLYMDGVKDAKTYDVGAVVTSTAPLAIGGLLNGQDGVIFNGAIDDFRFYQTTLGASEIAQMAKPVTSVSVAPSTATLEIGDTTTLTANVLPEDAANQAVIWTSSNSEIATVGADGLVTAIAAGNATITATTVDGGYQASAAITVKGESQVSEAKILSARFDLAQNQIILDFDAALDSANVAEISNYTLTGGATVTSAALDPSDNTKLILTVADVTARTYLLSLSILDANEDKIDTSVSVDPNLIAYWPLDEGAGNAISDFSGNGADGSGLALEWVAGQSGTGLNFGTADKAVKVPNTSVGMTENAFTISLWAKANTAITAGSGMYQNLFSKGPKDAGHFEMYMTSDRGTENALYFYVMSSASGQAQDDYPLNASLPADGEWHHIAATMLNGNMQFYVDGVRVSEWVSMAGAADAEAADLVFGSLVDGTNLFDGGLDDIRIYNRSLTAEEIANLYEPKPPVAVESVSLDVTEKTLKVGEDFTLTATVSPANADNQFVTWSSSDNDIATVDQNGKVTAIAAGEATITVTTKDGAKTASCVVTVSQTDVVAPTALYARFTNDTTIEVVFNEALDQTTAETVSNYTLADATISSAVLGADGKTVTLTVAGAAKQDYALAISSVADVAGNAISETSLFVAPGLLAYWRFDEGSGTEVLDTTGFNSPFVNSSASYVESKEGNNTALEFNGTSSRVVGSTNTNLGESFSISAFVKPVRTRTGETSYNIVLAKGSKLEPGHIEVYVSPTGTFEFYAPDLSVLDTGRDAGVFDSLVEVDDETWHQVGVTFADGTLKMYVDGKVARTFENVTGTIADTAQAAFTFGCMTDNSFPYTGALDEVRFYDYALTDEAMAKLAGVEEPSDIPVTGVSVAPSTGTLEIGDTLDLTATVAPDNATNKAVTWSSSDDDIATVDQNGKVTAIAAGTATITVTTVDGAKTATCTITVNEEVVNIPVTSIQLSQTDIYGFLGDLPGTTIHATVSPKDATNPAVVWSSSDEDVATVDENGDITFVGVGTATITATAADGSGVSASCQITLVIPIDDITLSAENLQIDLGETVALTATITPADATNQTLTWWSNNESVATVDENGKVTGHTCGSATIYAMSQDGSDSIAICHVKVIRPVTKLKIAPYSVRAFVGETIKLGVEVTPLDASIQDVNWVSSDPAVASVDNTGRVVTYRPGKSRIYAVAKDGSNVYCYRTVTVYGPLVENARMTDTTVERNSWEDPRFYYDLNYNGYVDIGVYNAQGKLVRTLRDQLAAKAANGRYATWNLKDNQGNYVPAGTYTVAVQATLPTGELSTNQLVTIQVVNPPAAKVSNYSATASKNFVEVNYTLNTKAAVNVYVYDSQGRQIFKDKNVLSNPGTTSYFWNLRDANGKLVPKGNYSVNIYAWNSLGKSAISYGKVTIK